MVPESVSSLLGAEASEGPPHSQRGGGGDDDSLSAESVDSVHGKERPAVAVCRRSSIVSLTFLRNKWLFCPVCVSR